MLYDRAEIIDKISRTFSILMCDIKLHQSINDFSINIHAEDFFKDIINRIFGANYVNSNSAEKNAAYIDLVDHGAKKIIQVTSTATKQKIEHSLKILNNPNYQGYRLELFYLLEKPTQFQQKSTAQFLADYGIRDICAHLKDSRDLLDSIKQLEEQQLVTLYRDYFSSIEEKYTDEIALQIIFELLLQARTKQSFNYDDDFGSIDTAAKITLNNLNSRISQSIQAGLDYTQSIYNFDDENQLNDLRTLIVDDFYASILRQQLRSFVLPQLLVSLTVKDLHDLAQQHPICFNKVLFALQQRIESAIIKIDFNSHSVSWIIIAYFFELCDVGAKL